MDIIWTSLGNNIVFFCYKYPKILLTVYLAEMSKFDLQNIHVTYIFILYIYKYLWIYFIYIKIYIFFHMSP